MDGDGLYWAVTDIAVLKRDIAEIKKMKLSYIEALSEIKGAFAETEAK